MSTTNGEILNEKLDQIQSFNNLHVSIDCVEYIITSKLLNSMFNSIDRERANSINFVNGESLNQLEAYTDFNYDTFNYEIHIAKHRDFRDILDAYKIVMGKLYLFQIGVKF